MNRSMFAAALALTLIAGAAAAQPAGAAGLREACGADIQKLCAGVQPGGGRILQCIKEHAADVSPGCKTAIAQAMAARKAEGQSPAPATH
jgi:hypothetical protein